MMKLRTFSVFIALAVHSSAVFAETDSPSTTGPVKAKVKSTSLVSFLSRRTKFGKLLWKGGLEISSSDPRFGGFSGLALSRDGTRFVALSDRAWWLQGSFVLDKGILKDAKNLTMAPLKIEPGKRSTSWRDSESVSPWSARGIDGRLLVAFERRERILSYRFGKKGPAARPTRIRSPKAMSSGPFNRELEAIGRFYSGPKKNWLLAVSERNLDRNGNIRGWSWRGKRTHAWSIKRFENYDVTDLAIAPDGKSFFTLERSFNLSSFPGFAVRRFKTENLKAGKTIEGELLFAGRQPFFSIDNMEGIAIHKSPEGKLQLTLISDDNFNRTLQSTLIFRFELIN